MKTVKAIAVLLFAITLVSACGGNTPEDTLMKYFKAAKAADFKAAKKCCTKEVVKEFDQLISEYTEENVKNLKEKNANVEITFIRAELDGDKATVYFEENRGDQGQEKSILMKQEDGKWKIAELY